MALRPKTRRILWFFAIVLVILLVLAGLFAWTKFFREEKEVFANEEEHFKYGSLGAEGDRGIPYYLWLVLPRVFPELMPGPGGYKSFGVVWEEGRELPVGFSKKRVGFERVTNNCAVCHSWIGKFIVIFSSPSRNRRSLSRKNNLPGWSDS